ncbi:MAG: RagB/SusD family nutrient uptake outer membrane protein [Tannerella sp.]|jgi:hypothetical protein|nr:RagB/SusD family nutrient uptake outer membrane protein [Tannerella sp.]
MKRILYILIALLPLFGLASCMDDFLEVQAESTFLPATIFSDPTLAEGAVFGIYDVTIRNAFGGRLWSYKGMNTDAEMHIQSANTNNTNNHIAVSVYNNRGTDNTLFSGAVAYAFAAVEAANVCIDGLEKYGDPQPDTKMGYLLGESLFLRAWLYYELINWFGNIPARFEPVDDNILYIGRTDRDIVYRQLLEDLRIAAELMPWAGTSEQTAEVIRPNRAAAKALRARIALAAGGYGYHTYGEIAVARLSNDPELTVEKTYAIARDECLEIMQNEGKGFILEEDFGKIFKDNCKAILTAGGEPLFKLPFKYNSRGNWMRTAGVFHRGAGGSGNPDSGTDPYTTVALGGEHGLVPTVFYDYEREDTRRDISVAPFRWANGRQELATVRGMMPGKLRAEWIDLGKGAISVNNNDGITPIVVRYADVLLMFAEAENQLSGPTGAAKEALNRVRTRAYGGVSQMAYVESRSASRETLLEAIQDERRLEFVGETIRKYDLIRWNLLKANMDRAMNDMRDLRALSGAYADVPAYVFWKYRPDDPDEREIVCYGFERNEFAPGTSGATVADRNALNAWMTANGWRHWNPSGNAAVAANPTLWINPSTTGGYLRDAYITCLYVNNPDRQQACPLPMSIIVDSQGMLSNKDVGY